MTEKPQCSVSMPSRENSRVTTLTALVVSVLMVVTGCSSSVTGTQSSSDQSPKAPLLDRGNWTQSTYDGLVQLVGAESGSGKLAIFDFDNTTQARDVGEAATAQTQADGALDLNSIPAALVPPLVIDGKQTTIEDGVFTYYDALTELGTSQDDPRGAYPANTLVAQFWTGKTVQQFVDQVARSYDNGAGEKDLQSGELTAVEGVGRQFIYPEMADLYGFLRNNGYDVWITSAGVSWAVRWMVKNVMNPQIVAKYGEDAALPLDRIVAISTLLRDKRTGEILTDYGLTQGNPNEKFLQMEPEELANLEILGLADSLNSWSGGKVGAIQDRITRDRPYLSGGDSDGDFEMLNSAENRLWVTRLDKPSLQTRVAEQFDIDQPGNWLLQPTISTAPVGFLPTECAMDQKLAANPNPTTVTAVDESMKALTPTNKLGSFPDC